MLIIGAEFFAPIAAVVAAEVAGKVNVQREGTGGGVDLPKREAGFIRWIGMRSRGWG